MKVPIAFCDLSHKNHTTKMTPLGISMIASYALKKFDSLIEAKIFRSVNEFVSYFEKNVPKIVCFSNYSWNGNLIYQIATRIKQKYPKTIIVFGGPNYEVEAEAQEDYLKTHPDIDIYVAGEGEEPFAKLLNLIFEYDFDIEKIKKEKIKIPNCHYIIDNEFIRGELLPPMLDLNDIPSPYLSGLMDKELEDNHKPLMQTTRGCPFACTFCQEGADYFNKIRRFSIKRLKDELNYIAKRVKVPSLSLADSNFGMYKEDLEFCKEIVSIREKYNNWPENLEGISGKNNKKIVLEAISIIGKNFYSAAVQSTDEEVLKQVKRKNISVSKMIDVVHEAEKSGANAYSELILGLPGDSKENHFKSNSQLIDAEISMVRTHQFAMLPGSESVSKESREKFGLITRFRPVPMTATSYSIFGEDFHALEIDEICIGSNTLSIDDYVECRLFNLTIEIFYNGRVFEDLFKLLKRNDVIISEFIRGVHQRIRSSKSLSKIYDDFIRETNELWETKEEVVKFLKKDGILEKLNSGEIGNNEQLLYSSTAKLYFQEEIHEIAFSCAADMLQSNINYNESTLGFLQEFKRYCLSTKRNMLETENSISESFNYDFPSIIDSEFKNKPSAYHLSKKVRYEFRHTKKQQELLNTMFSIYGKSKDSLGFILNTELRDNDLFRTPNETCDPI
jgi:radical SAM superfamily enzyme YgiQ (UPF0313 family)